MDEQLRVRATYHCHSDKGTHIFLNLINMDNTISQELQALEAQLTSEFSWTSQAETQEATETQSTEGTKEVETESETIDESQSDDTDKSSDELEKLKEQRQRMLATKSKDEKEKALLREELEEARRLAQEAEERIAKFKSTSNEERDEDSDTDYIQAVAQKHVAKIDMDRLAKQEKLSFIKENSELSTEDFASIEAIKSDLPNLTWDRAKMLYLAESRPELLSSKEQSKKSKISLWDSQAGITDKPKDIKSMWLNDLEKELSKMDISF